jgi:UDP-N-acetylmuramyl pentapeptide phosphotransferase/UDP-N-acetylglucosamine-1-phosphate transferase
VTPEISSFGFAIAGTIASALVCLLIIATQSKHARLSQDSSEGIQKLHSRPTPRIGGIGLVVGLVLSWLLLDGEAKTLLGALGLASIPALFFGLLEDVTKSIGPGIRMVAALVAGVLFCLISGYSIQSVGLWWFDPLLTSTIFAIGFTAFAIGTATNAINLIDGFHGLASGTMLIMLAVMLGITASTGDWVLFQVTLAIAAATVGFLVVNFPFGRIFLGDGGAYFLGFLVSALTVILPARNPEVSPWISPLILSYPLTETVISIARRLKGEGQHPGQPDTMHLHHLIHRVILRARLGKRKNEALEHGLTSLSVWSLPALAGIFVAISGLEAYYAIRGTAAIFFVYLVIYKLVSIADKKAARTTP